MKLLVIRCSDGYLRIRNVENGEKQFEFCLLEKASVFPLCQLEQVRDYVGLLSDSGKFPEIRQLSIYEEPYRDKLEEKI